MALSPPISTCITASPGQGVRLQWRERVAWLSGVGGDGGGGWKPGNWSHLTWPPPLTRLPVREPHSPLPQVEQET